MDDDRVESEVNPVDARKQVYRDAFKTLDLHALISEMDMAQKKKNSLEEQLAEANACFDVLRIELVPGKMEAEGIERISLAGIGRVSLTGDMYVVQVKSQREEFFKWLRAHRMGALIVEQVNASTLKASVKDRIKSGGLQYPEEFVKVTPFTRASITRG